MIDPFEDAVFIEFLIQKSNKDWGDWTLNSPVHVDRLGTVTLIEELSDSREDPGYYGEYREGSTANARLVFKVEHDGVTRFYAKHGEYDSYGGERYEGRFEEVTPVEKTVTVYQAVND